MTTSTPKIGYLVLIALIAVIVGFIFFKGCDDNDNNVVNTPTKQEQARQSVMKGRAQKDKELAVDTLRYLTQLEANRTALNRLTSQGRQKDKLIAELKARYAKKPTLSGCDTLVKEQGSRIDSLKAEVAAHRKDSLNKETLLKAQAGHIVDRNLRIDSLNAGWHEANRQLARKPLKVYATAAFEQQPITNNVKIGATATKGRWLFGYEKGWIENTHEFKAGIEIRLK